jgi:hypothetical protein
MPAHIYDPFCHHGDCTGQPRPIPFFDYHTPYCRTPYFSGYTPQAWCSIECILSDLLHAIQDEDMGQLRTIRYLIESGYALPPERTAVQSDEGDLRKEDDKGLVTKGESILASVSETVSAVEDTAEPVAKPTTAEVPAATSGAPNVTIESDNLHIALPEKDKVMRFAFLPPSVGGKLMAARAHYLDHYGSVRCLASGNNIGDCCVGLNQTSSVHIVAPIVHYLNADLSTGKMEWGVPVEWELAYLDMNYTDYRFIERLPDDDRTPHDLDIIMVDAPSEGEPKYHRISPKSRWTLDPEVQAEVTTAAAQMFLQDGGKRLASKLGKNASLHEWMQILSTMGAWLATVLEVSEGEVHVETVAEVEALKVGFGDDKVIFQRCRNRLCDYPAARPIVVASSVDAKPLLTDEYCSSQCYREGNAAYCLGIFKTFEQQFTREDVELHLVVNSATGEADIATEGRPGEVSLYSSQLAHETRFPVGAFATDPNGNLVGVERFHPTRPEHDGVIEAVFARSDWRKREDSSEPASLYDIEDDWGKTEGANDNEPL